MKPRDKHHKWIEWSEKDNVYLGVCLDIVTGTRRSDPTQFYEELCGVVDYVLAAFQASGHALPKPVFKPMRKAA